MRRWMFMFKVFAMIAAILFSPPPETCASIHALVGGELVAWIGYPQGWDLPEDMERTGWIDFAEGGVIEYESESEDARYVIVFTSYDYSTDANGNHGGNHEFCGYYRIANG